MVRNQKQTIIAKYKKVCHEYYTMEHDYSDITNLTSSNLAIYRKMRRLKAKMEKLSNSEFLPTFLQEQITNEVRQSIFDHEETIEQSTESVSNSEQNSNETDFSSHYCDNCLRKQSQYLVSTFGELYSLQFSERSKNDFRRKQKFHYSPRGDENLTVHICQECDKLLVKENGNDNNKSSKYSWPSFVISVLTNDDVILIYGTKV